VKVRKPQISRRIIRHVGQVAVLWLLTMGVARGSGVNPTKAWIDIYSISSTLAGQPLPVDACVAAFDPQGVQCAEFIVDREGWYGIMPCYGDDGATGLDEGASPGQVLHFSINGVAATPRAVSLNATPVAPGTIVTWTENGDRWEVDLQVPPSEYSSYDIDCDCDIDVADIMATASRWDCECGDGCYEVLCDLDGDCDIDIVDIMAIASRWGCACGDECYD